MKKEKFSNRFQSSVQKNVGACGMKCRRCKEVKPENEMYSDLCRTYTICNKCVRVKTNERVKMKIKKQRDFVKKFNEFMGASQ